MSRAHVTLLSSLLVAMLALPADAQTPTDTTAKDSVPAKKKSRFGGMMNKAKQVAGNKAVQDAAKGAATGVACTVVPGAAVVSATTGTGPCANAGVVGLLKKGGIAGAASTMAGGAAGNAAAKAAGKMGGVKGAAAAGALGAVGGQGGLTKAAAGAAASAMAPKAGSMIGNAAAQAAAARMMSGAAGAAGKGAAVPAGMPNGADMAAAMAAMNSAMGSVNMAAAGGKKVETVDFRELKALLPESLRGMKRTEASGEKNGAMGITISTAEGVYSAPEGNTVTLTIADIGSVSGMAAAATYAWTTGEIDRESDSGYEKTTTFKGFKALEKFDKQNKSGEFSVLVEGRFVVGASGSNVNMDAMKAAVGSVDLRKLAGMKNKGVK